MNTWHDMVVYHYFKAFQGKIICVNDYRMVVGRDGPL
jgi:hypothetical protein